MSASSTNDTPLERLNYYNGQRLEASDLQLEQDYHMRVRRMFNQAVYVPGIASGLEVSPDPDNPHRVEVSPGVALDALGREVILLEKTKLDVAGLPNTEQAWVYGNFLVIRYAEETTAETNCGCSQGNGEVSWGGPARIRSEPILEFQDAWPDEAAGATILAQVELNAGCAVAQIHNQVRKYVDAARSQTLSLSLEGEKDIDGDNAKVLSFHVQGGLAKTATLYLQASQFSTYFYTQLGAHKHSIPELDSDTQKFTDGSTSDTTALSHTHIVDITELAVTDVGSNHGADHDIKFPAKKESGNMSNKYTIDVSGTADDFRRLSELNFEGEPGVVLGGLHSHTLSLPHEGQIPSGPPDTPLSVSTGDHTHTTIEDETGVTGQKVGGLVIDPGTTKRLKHIDELRVILDGTDITQDIIAQLGGEPNGWKTLGDGSSAHNLVKFGTPEIALERIKTINAGDHTLEFIPGNDSGGNIRYNLYVE